MALKLISDLEILGNVKSTASAFQQPVLDIQTDATLDPGASPTTGDRYILTNTASLHANFGSITGVGDNDIVEYNGSAFAVAWDASTNGSGGHAYDKDSTAYYEFDGSSWSTSGEPSGGDGIDVTSNVVSVDLATDPGLEFSSNQLRAKVDAAGALERVADGLDVKALGIDTARLAADAVDDTKLADDAVGNEHLQNNAVNTNELASDAVTTVKITDANVTVAKIETLAEAELIVGNGTANSKVDTSSTGDILSDETNGLTIKADAVDDTKIADNSINTEHLNYGTNLKLRSGALTDAFSSTTRTFTHNWNTTDVTVEIFDVTTGETVLVDQVVRAANTIAITVTQTPTNSLRVLLRELDAAQTTITVA